MAFKGEQKRVWQREYNRRTYSVRKDYFQTPEVKERMRLNGNVWKKNNPDRVRETNRVYLETRRKNDLGFRLKVLLGNRVRIAIGINGKKCKRTVQLVGCSIDQLMGHLEIRFQPGMSWDNYGPIWHIDHVRPCASFNLSDAEQQKLCFNYKNLQPLFAEENRKKGASIAWNSR